MKKIILLTGFIIPVICFLTLSSCTRRGCQVECATNYDPRAEKSSDNCTACTDPFAVNFCSGAHVDNGTCEYARTFWDDYADTGWIDIWVADFDSIPFTYIYEGRITTFHPNGTPDCLDASGTVQVSRRPGVYSVEYENDQGNIFIEEVVFRNDDCRLYEINY